MHDHHRRRFDLTGKRALVTASVRGLGLAIARGLAEAGAWVAINGRDAATVADAVATLRSEGLSADSAAFDVTDEAAVGSWVAGAGTDLDILVNGVGARDRRATADLPPADFAAMLQAQVTAAYALTRTVVPGMAARGGGVVINMTSVAGPLARPGDPGYTAAKGGLAALTRSLAVEFAPQRIRVNAIAPGFFDTEANAEWVGEPTVERYVAERIPMARWGQPEEVVGAAVFLASDAATYITGHSLLIDGGLMARM